MTVTTEIGKPRARKEDARLVTGQTNWTDNIVLPGMVHVAFVRSPMAHARITSVDLSAARAAPGVIAAFSGADFAAEQGSLPCAWPVTPDIVIPAHPPMATDEVRYVGEIVACVVARDRYAAADAFQLIDVDYEPLPAVLDMEAALAEGSPKVHEAGNKSFVWPCSARCSQSSSSSIGMKARTATAGAWSPTSDNHEDQRDRDAVAGATDAVAMTVLEISPSAPT